MEVFASLLSLSGRRASAARHAQLDCSPQAPADGSRSARRGVRSPLMVSSEITIRCMRWRVGPLNRWVNSPTCLNLLIRSYFQSLPLPSLTLHDCEQVDQIMAESITLIPFQEKRIEGHREWF